MNPRTGYPFEPPRERGTLRALALAALMHVLLALLLYHGMKWQNSTPAGAEAEIWTEVPDLSTPAPPPQPAPAPAPAQVAPPPAQREEADIALEQEKKRKRQEAERQAQLAEQERLKKQAEQQAEAKRQQELAAQLAAQKAAAEKAAAQKAAAEKLKQQQAQAEKLRQQQLAEQKQKQQQEQLKQQQLKEQQEKLAQQKKQAEQQAAKAKQAAEQAAKQKLDQERRARLAQLQGLAGDSPAGNGLAKSGTGSGAGGNATSAGYAEKVQRRVRPNIIWSGPTDGLETTIAVRCAPDGALLDARIVRSSGNPQWDDAALRAVQKSDPMPLDTNGKAPSSFNIRMRPAGA